MKRSFLPLFLLPFLLSASTSAQSAELPTQQTSTTTLERYVCKDLNDLLRDTPDIKRRLKKLLGANYRLFMTNLTVSGSLNNIEGFLTMAGLAPHMGTVEEAIILISLKTGKIHCVILSRRFGGKHKVFTEDSKSVPASLIKGILYDRSVQSQFKC